MTTVVARCAVGLWTRWIGRILGRSIDRGSAGKNGFGSVVEWYIKGERDASCLCVYVQVCD